MKTGKKRLLFVVLALVLALAMCAAALTACGEEKPDNPNGPIDGGG